MVYYDNFLPEHVLDETLAYCQEAGFHDWVVGDKTFNSVHPMAALQELKRSQVSSLINQPVELIFSYIRRATGDMDTNWNIHSDQIINGEQPRVAAVWYLSEKPQGVIGGTACWRHEKWGTHLTGTTEEYDAQRANENDLGQFELDQVVGYKQNRCVVYDANRFHSKYPNNVGFERIVMASFYK